MPQECTSRQCHTSIHREPLLTPTISSRDISATYKASPLARSDLIYDVPIYGILDPIDGNQPCYTIHCHFINIGIWYMMPSTVSTGTFPLELPFAVRKGEVYWPMPRVLSGHVGDWSFDSVKSLISVGSPAIRNARNSNGRTGEQ